MLGNIKKILHPTDFSEPAQNAFSYAREIARIYDANLVVMHSVKLPYAYGSEKMMEDVIHNNLDKDLSIETSIEFGDTISNILEFPGDLIVIGSKGRSNMGKILFGSISSEIMVKSPIPVLVTPADQSYSDFSRLIFATDYRDRDLEILGELTAWAKQFEAEITVLHIASEDNLESRIKLRGFKAIASEKIDYSQISYRLIFEKDFFTGLSAFLHGQADELVVMTREKKTFFESLLNQNHIRQTVYTKVPILILPGDKTLEKEN